MASKHTIGSIQEALQNKKLKLNDNLDLPDDMVLSEDELSSEISAFLNYDFVLNQFGIGIMKEAHNKTTQIRLTEAESDGVIRLIPYAMKVAGKYLSTKASKPIDIPLEPVDLNPGDSGAVLSIKENHFKRGDIQFDIRKCMKRGDGSLMFTREGVRLEFDSMEKLREKLASYKNEVTKAVNRTRKLLMTAQACLLIQEIDNLNDFEEDVSCYGCKVDHPSQRQHMGIGGCMCEDATDAFFDSWTETVKKHWKVVFSTSSVEDACDLANVAISMINGIKGLVYSCIEKMEDPLEDELKEMVMKRKELYNDEMFSACKKMMIK